MSATLIPPPLPTRSVPAASATVTTPATVTTRVHRNRADPRNRADERRWYTLAVLCLSLLVIVMDTTIVNVAVADPGHAPARPSTASLQWIVDAYTLAFAALLLLRGRARRSLRPSATRCTRGPDRSSAWRSLSRRVHRTRPPN